MKGPRLVLLAGGKKDEDGEPAPMSRASLRVVRSDQAAALQSSLEQTVEAAQRLRSEIEQRIAQALDPEPQPKP